jgi:N-acetylneuraminate lyase
MPKAPRMNQRLTGLIAAGYTPMHPDGTLNLGAIPKLVDHLSQTGVSGVYIGGSTGEGMSLTSDERRQLAEEYVKAAQGRLKTIVHVGHNSRREARELARHAELIGADVISATAPSYYKITSVKNLIDCMCEVAVGAPRLPFYYYHIPALTGAAIDMADFLDAAKSKIPNLVGLKFTAPFVHEYQACQAVQAGAFDIVWGTDEMLLSALVVGAQAAIGSTYSIAAPLYLAIIDSYERNETQRAAHLQLLAVQLVRLLAKHPFHAAVKCILNWRGLDCGPCRAPQVSLCPEQESRLRAELEAAGFDQWLLGAETNHFLDRDQGHNGSSHIPRPHLERFTTRTSTD